MSLSYVSSKPLSGRTRARVGTWSQSTLAGGLLGATRGVEPWDSLKGSRPSFKFDRTGPVVKVHRRVMETASYSQRSGTESFAKDVTLGRDVLFQEGLRGHSEDTRALAGGRECAAWLCGALGPRTDSRTGTCNLVVKDHFLHAEELGIYLLNHRKPSKDYCQGS